MAWVKNWFSNMLPCDHPIKDDMGIEYHTTENFYQAQKFSDPAVRKELAGLGPYQAKKRARGIRLSEAEWNEFSRRKLEVMERGLRQKFAPGTTWAARLMSSDGPLVEWNNWGDRFWGKTLEGIGENHLGWLLEKIRKELLEGRKS